MSTLYLSFKTTKMSGLYCLEDDALLAMAAAKTPLLVLGLLDERWIEEGLASSFTDYICLEQPAYYTRCFYRNEANLTTHQTRRIPVIEFETADKKKYCFAFEDKLVITDNPRYYRGDWPHADNH